MAGVKIAAPDGEERVGFRHDCSHPARLYPDGDPTLPVCLCVCWSPGEGWWHLRPGLLPGPRLGLLDDGLLLLENTASEPPPPEKFLYTLCVQGGSKLGWRGVKIAAPDGSKIPDP